MKRFSILVLMKVDYFSYHTEWFIVELISPAFRMHLFKTVFVIVLFLLRDFGFTRFWKDKAPTQCVPVNERTLRILNGAHLADETNAHIDALNKM